jgi:hypothetical protein
MPGKDDSYLLQIDFVCGVHHRHTSKAKLLKVGRLRNCVPRIEYLRSAHLLGQNQRIDASANIQPRQHRYADTPKISSRVSCELIRNRPTIDIRPRVVTATSSSVPQVGRRRLCQMRSCQGKTGRSSIKISTIDAEYNPGWHTRQATHLRTRRTEDTKSFSSTVQAETTAPTACDTEHQQPTTQARTMTPVERSQR